MRCILGRAPRPTNRRAPPAYALPGASGGRGWGAGGGRRGAEDRVRATAAHACCGPEGFSGAGDRAPWPFPDAGALLSSPIHAPPRVAIRLRAQSSGRPSRRLASCVPASVPLGHKRTYSERNIPFPMGGPARSVQVDWDSRPLRP